MDAHLELAASVPDPPRAPIRALSGHLWTLGGLLQRNLMSSARPLSAPWRTEVADPTTGIQPVTGHLERRQSSRRLLVLLHGLGGSSRSVYMVRFAAAGAAAGCSTLRLDLRGAAGEGGDFYHAGLTADVHAALADRSLAEFDTVLLAGVSLGGHVALRYATEAGDRRVRAVAAVSAPLDLAAGADALDRAVMAPYRRYLLRGLKKHGARASRAGILATSPAELRRVRTLRQWDTLTVAPRFGFVDAADYYARASVGPRLGALRCPALLLAAIGDPMVPRHAIEPAVKEAGDPAALTLWWSRRGGHLAFPQRLDLGAGAGFARQVVWWLTQRGGERRRRSTSARTSPIPPG